MNASERDEKGEGWRGVEMCGGGGREGGRQKKKRMGVGMMAADGVRHHQCCSGKPLLS